MRTNSGVKPKMKGNAVFTVLLFLLCTLPAQSFDLATSRPHDSAFPLSHSPISQFSHFPDTLILDGEIIEIKQKPVKTNTDSLQEARRKDVLKVRSPYLIELGAHAGMSAGIFNITSNSDSLTSVNEFLNKKNAVQFNSHFGFDIRLPIYKGIDLGIGYFFNTISLEGLVMDESTLCPEDERVSFENRNGQLWQNYVVFIDPGYETREDQVTLNTYKVKIRTREIPLSLRYNFTIPDSPITLFAGGGVLFRSTSKFEGMPTSIYLMNQSGDWRKIFLEKSDVVTKSQLYQVELGMKYRLTPSISAVVNLGFTTKQNELSSSPTYNWDWSSGFLRIGVTKTFNLFKPATLFSK
jgi:hypothetical protein